MLGDVPVTPRLITVLRVEVSSVDIVQEIVVLSCAAVFSLRGGVTIGIGTVRGQRVADHRSPILPTLGFRRIPDTLPATPLTLHITLVSGNRLTGCSRTLTTVILAAIVGRIPDTLLAVPAVMGVASILGTRCTRHRSSIFTTLGVHRVHRMPTMPGLRRSSGYGSIGTAPRATIAGIPWDVLAGVRIQPVGMAQPRFGGLLLLVRRCGLLIGIHALAFGGNLGVLGLGLQPLGFDFPFLRLQFCGIRVGLRPLCGVRPFTCLQLAFLLFGTNPTGFFPVTLGLLPAGHTSDDADDDQHHDNGDNNPNDL